MCVHDASLLSFKLTLAPSPRVDVVLRNERSNAPSDFGNADIFALDRPCRLLRECRPTCINNQPFNIIFLGHELLDYVVHSPQSY